MKYLKNKVLVSSDGMVLTTINNEILLSTDPASVVVGSERYVNALSNPIIEPVYKVCLLDEDESDFEDITEYIIDDSASYNIELKTGLRSGLSFELSNIDRRWGLQLYRNGIYFNSRFSLYLGIVVDNTVYWQKKGIFVVENIIPNRDNETISLQLKDKFAVLDGTVGGEIADKVYFPNGTKIKDIVNALLLMDKGNGRSYDSKPIIFPHMYEHMCIMYDIIKESGSNIGAILIELAELMSCYVWYDDGGRLVFVHGYNNRVACTLPVIYHFTQDSMDLIDGSSIEYNATDVVNKVVVIGGNINGYIFSATAQNDNPRSPTNIKLFPDAKTKIVTNDNIYSDALAQELADFTLMNEGRLIVKEKFSCIWIPHLTVNCLLTMTDEYMGYLAQKFVINSLSFALSGTGTISGSITKAGDII